MKPVEDSGQTQRNGKIDWAHATLLYPIDKKDMKTLPAPNPGVIPQIQHKLFQETPERKVIRLQRLEAVKSNFTHAWNGYKQHAWLNDEVRPISGTGLNTFGGWAATLVDSLGGSFISFIKVTIMANTKGGERYALDDGHDQRV